MDKLKPCPFCGGTGHIRYKNAVLYGMNYFGDRKVRMRSYVQCGRCKARGGVFGTTVILRGSGKLEKDYKDYIDEQVSRMWNARSET